MAKGKGKEERKEVREELRGRRKGGKLGRGREERERNWRDGKGRGSEVREGEI